MKLVKMRCPQCGAGMDLSEDQTTAVCSYCGCEMYVDPQVSPDEAYENRRKKKVDRLIAQLDHIAECIPKEQHAAAALREAHAKLQTAKEEEKNILQHRRFFPLYLLGAAMLILFCILASSVTIPGKIVGILLTAAILTGMFRLIRFLLDRKIPKVQKNLSLAQSHVDKSRNALRKIQGEYDITLLPEDLRGLDAIEYITKMLRSGRAYDIPAAAVLYEEYLERKNLQQQLELQRIQVDQLKKSVNANQKNRNFAMPDDTDDTNDLDVLGTAAAVGGAFLVGAKVWKDISKHL